MNIIALSSAADLPAPTPPARLAPSDVRGGSGAWIRAALVTLLALAALLCTGLGGTVGVASQTLANKLAANAQLVQRHGGTSLASRAVRRDLLAVTSVKQAAKDSHAVVLDHSEGTLLAGRFTLQVDEQRAGDLAASSDEPRLKLRNRANPSRAPPALA